MKLTLYRSGKVVTLYSFAWARRAWLFGGTVVVYGKRFRVRETPEEIEALDVEDDLRRQK